MVQGYDSRLACERSRVQIPTVPNFYTSLLLNHFVTADTPQGESNHIHAGETKNWDNQACKETSTREGITISGEKNKSKTPIIHRKSRSGVSSAVVFACGSRSRREKFLDQFPSIPDLTLLEVELLASYRVSQNLHLLTRSEARTIHTASSQSLRHKEIHGKKSELRHTALNS